MAVSNLSILDGGSILQLDFDSGAAMRFHALWLRDNSPDTATRDPGNGQRLITMKDLPAETMVQSASVSAEGIEIIFAPGGVSACYDPDWLAAHGYDKARSAQLLPEHAESWDAALTRQVPSGHFPELCSKTPALRDWLSHIRRYGFAKLTGLPVESGNLFKIVDLFGYVRETNYGRHFEVRTEVNPVNLAFTGLGLQAHTDNPYRDPVPTIQVLSCLENSAQGGENMVVDGFACAERLRREDPEGFALLARHSVRFDYAGEAGVRLQSLRPMIELAPEGHLVCIRFNSRSIAPLTTVPFDDMPAYYAAYRRLSDIIDDPAMEVTFKLEPGEAFVVDNTRVLHARKGYSGAGNRWLQGCYADKDALLSKLSAIEAAS